MRKLGQKKPQKMRVTDKGGRIHEKTLIWVQQEWNIPTADLVECSHEQRRVNAGRATSLADTDDLEQHTPSNSANS